MKHWRVVVCTILLLAIAAMGAKNRGRPSFSPSRENPNGNQAEEPRASLSTEPPKLEDARPVVMTNCVRCHLTAGRELTVPVHDFARSAHDRAKMSCNDCHGGNTADDAAAHEQEHGFIGTKLSAHMLACADCHHEEAEVFAKGPHFWDLNKRINREFPVCIDCHGNHDVGKPPADFALQNVCAECHKQFATDQPGLARIAQEQDRLWKILRQVHAKNRNEANPTPSQFRRELASLRYATGRLIHSATSLDRDRAERLKERIRQFTIQLETWLTQQEEEFQ